MALTISKARIYLENYYDKTHPTEEDDFLMIECLEYLIKETSNPDEMMNLGGYYYGKKQFDLAEEYYLMAAEYKSVDAYACLGYIYYYGRVDQPNYEKAFHYYKLAADAGDIESAYKVADMYKNGFFVEKNYDEYKRIIESLYPKVKDANRLNKPLPEIFTRLAGIYKKEGRNEEAVELLYQAKDFLAQRLIYSNFFGNLTIMKYLIRDLYSLVPFDVDYVDLFDLYYLLQKPCIVILHIFDKEYEINGLDPNDITLEDTHYENVESLFSRAKINNYNLSSLYRKIDYIEVREWKS